MVPIRRFGINGRSFSFNWERWSGSATKSLIFSETAAMAFFLFSLTSSTTTVHSWMSNLSQWVTVCVGVYAKQRYPKIQTPTLSSKLSSFGLLYRVVTILTGSENCSGQTRTLCSGLLNDGSHCLSLVTTFLFLKSKRYEGIAEE